MTTLGKRHRTNSSLRRTTSMMGFAASEEEQQQQGRQPPARSARGGGGGGISAAPSLGWGAMQRRHSGNFAVAETAAFLKACGICNRHLGPGRDTFIYMGEVAFCSHECRQQQMNLDELKEKKCFQQENGNSGSDKSGNSGTVAAA